MAVGVIFATGELALFCIIGPHLITAEDSEQPPGVTKNNESADCADLRRFDPPESVKSVESVDDLSFFRLRIHSNSPYYLLSTICDSLSNSDYSLVIIIYSQPLGVNPNSGPCKAFYWPPMDADKPLSDTELRDLHEPRLYHSPQRVSHWGGRHELRATIADSGFALLHACDYNPGYRGGV
jgi:hypothetical protein